MKKNKDPFLLSSLYSFFYKTKNFNIFEGYESDNNSGVSSEDLT